MRFSSSMRVATCDRCSQDVFDRASGGETGVLGHVADPQAAAERARAAVGRRVAGEDLEEGRFAGAVGADEAGLVAFEQSEGQIVEERPASVSHAHGLAAEQERARHSTLLLGLLRLLLFLPHAGAFRHGLTSSRRALERFYRHAARAKASRASASEL